MKIYKINYHFSCWKVQYALIGLILYCCSINVQAQRVVYDAGHLAIVTENSLMRNSSALSHEVYLQKIQGSLNNINLNAGAVVTAQEMIYSGLSNVNGALRNGLMLKNMYILCADIRSYSLAMMDLARKQPYLLLLAEQMGREVNVRSLRLMEEVSSFVLKEGSNVLMNFNARDELMKKISDELHIISGLCYGGWKAMFWAAQSGIVRALNPFAAYLNTDKKMVEDIIRKAKFLKK